MKEDGVVAKQAVESVAKVVRNEDLEDKTRRLDKLCSRISHG